MIFFGAAIISAVITIYLIAGKWFNIIYRLIFGILSGALIALLVLFGLEFKISASMPEVERRVAVYAVDVSASTGININEIKDRLLAETPEYNVEIIPFSGSLRGPAGRQSSRAYALRRRSSAGRERSGRNVADPTPSPAIQRSRPGQTRARDRRSRSTPCCGEPSRGRCWTCPPSLSTGHRRARHRRKQCRYRQRD